MMQINDVHYHVTTSGNGTPLLLLHGFTGSSANWQRFFPAWAQHFTLIAPDLLGHGQTEAPPDPERYEMAQAAHDLVTLLQQLNITQPINLLGYSMGGRLALYFAVHHPDLVQHLILESASPGLADPQAAQERRTSDNALAQRIEDEGVEAFVNFWQQISLFRTQVRLSPSAQQNLRAQRLQNRALGLANSLRGMGTGQQPALWQRLPDLNVPVMLIAGAEDAKYVKIAGQMHDLLPRSKTHIVPSAGHTVHLEQPKLFEKIIAEASHG